MSIPKTLLGMPKKNFRIFIYLLVASVVLLGMGAYWNFFWPDVEYWPYLVGDILTIIPAIGVGLAALFLLRQFEPGEKPRAVWFWLTLAWWAWILGELTGLVYDIFKLPYPDIAVYDLFWTAGYIFFLLSLFFQFRNIYFSQSKALSLTFVIVVVVILLATFGLTQWAVSAGLGEGLSWFALYLAVFYPVCDVVIGVIALWLAFLFGRGAWGRPWWGLIVFAIADVINIFLWIGGEQRLADTTTTFLYSLSNTIYNAGYLTAMLGFFFILLLNFWSPMPQVDKEPGQAV